MITFTQLIQSSRTKDGAIYLDNAATSWPKPPGVAEAMLRYMGELGANPGRSAHRMSIQAARVIYQLRERIAAMFGAVDPLRVYFFAECDRCAKHCPAWLAQTGRSCAYLQHGA